MLPAVSWSYAFMNSFFKINYNVKSPPLLALQQSDCTQHASRRST